MRIIKTNTTQPLSFWFKSKGNSLEYHYIRNGLKLDVYELRNNNTTYKGKIISDLKDNPIIAKVQELVNGVVIKSKLI